MARCGCESVVAVGAAASGGACVTVTGAGTPSSPFDIAVDVDAAADNLLSCGGSGLYVPAPILDNGDASMLVSLVGPGDADYDLSVVLAPDSDVSGSNVLDLLAGGLGVASGPLNLSVFASDSALVGAPGPAEDQFWKVIAGTQIVALDASGNGVITFPAAFTSVLLSIVGNNGDAAASPAFSVGFGATGLGQATVNCTAVTDTDTVASTNVRIHYTAIGI